MFSKINYNRLYWVLFLLFIAGVLYSGIRNKKYSTAEGIEAKVIPLEGGEKLIDERDVKMALVRAFGTGLENTELKRLEIDLMERTLEADPFVLNAEMYIDQNNTLHVEIEQRQPVLRVLDNQGGNYYLDEHGVKMPPSKNFAARVMVVTGNISPYTPEFRQKRRSTLKDAFYIAQIVQQDAFLSHFIQQIHANNAGEFTMVPLVGDQKILLGSARKLEDKLQRLKTFYQKAMPYTGWQIYQRINLKFDGQVVCSR